MGYLAMIVMETLPDLTPALVDHLEVLVSVVDIIAETVMQVHIIVGKLTI